MSLSAVGDASPSSVTPLNIDYGSFMDTRLGVVSSDSLFEGKEGG